MKICIIGPSKYFFSGISAHTIFLANTLSRNQHRISVILLRKLVPRFLYPGKAHVNKGNYLMNLDDGIDVYDGMDWNSPLSWFRAYRFLKRHMPDALIMLWWTSSVAHTQLFLALANRLRIGAKLILEMHETVDPLEESILPIRLYSRIMGKLLMRNADAFTVHSTSVRSQIAQIYNIKADRISVKPFGIYDGYQRDCDKELTKAKLGIEEKYVILNFGSIRKYKGVSYLVEAFSALPESIAQDSRLVIAGEDWGEAAELEKAIQSSPFSHKITLNSHFIPDETVPEYFSAAEVVALPYLRSSGSGVANIAMTYGKPIITSELETMKEILGGYQGAIFTPIGDSAAIKEKLIQVYDKLKTGKLITFDPPPDTWTKVAKQYEGIIKKLKDKT